MSKMTCINAALVLSISEVHAEGVCSSGNRVEGCVRCEAGRAVVRGNRWDFRGVKAVKRDTAGVFDDEGVEEGLNISDGSVVGSNSRCGVGWYKTGRLVMPRIMKRNIVLIPTHQRLHAKPIIRPTSSSRARARPSISPYRPVSSWPAFPIKVEHDPE
jgi:hypothetical protein